MPKKITMTAKPPTAIADDWVAGTTGVKPAEPVNESLSQANSDNASEESGAVKRLTIDIPEELHARIKSQCALRRTKMADEIRKLLENSFSDA